MSKISDKILWSSCEAKNIFECASGTTQVFCLSSKDHVRPFTRLLTATAAQKKKKGEQRSIKITTQVFLDTKDIETYPLVLVYLY